MLVDSGSAERGRTSGKCRFVRRIMICKDYSMLFGLTSQEIEIIRSCGIDSIYIYSLGLGT